MTFIVLCHNTSRTYGTKIEYAFHQILFSACDKEAGHKTTMRYGTAGARDNSSIFIKECGSVATISWTTSKSGKVTQTYVYRRQSFLRQRHLSSRADDNIPIVGHRLLFLCR